MSYADIEEALFDHLSTALPVATPGDHEFEPPATGPWLEMKNFPSTRGDLDELSWDNDGKTRHRGFLQIKVYFRPDEGTVPAIKVAEGVMAQYPKGTRFGRVGVYRRPFLSAPVTDILEDRLFIPITIPYLGIF